MWAFAVQCRRSANCQGRNRVHRATGSPPTGAFSRLSKSPVLSRPGVFRGPERTTLLTHVGVIGVPAPKKKAADEITIQIGGVSTDDFVPTEVPEAAPSATPRQITIGTGDDDVLPVEEP